MRRIGKTDDGRVLIEATPAELRQIDTAIETLVEFQAACAGFAPEIKASAEVARALSPSTVKQMVRRVQGQVVGQPPLGSKVCRTCKAVKPLNDFAKFQRSCLVCMKAKHFPAVGAAAKKEAANPTADRVSKIRAADQRTKLKTGPREHDPDLDRPTEGGRVLPVGGEG